MILGVRRAQAQAPSAAAPPAIPPDGAPGPPPPAPPAGPWLEVYGHVMTEMGYDFGRVDPQWFDVMRRLRQTF